MILKITFFIAEVTNKLCVNIMLDLMFLTHFYDEGETFDSIKLLLTKIFF